MGNANDVRIPVPCPDNLEPDRQAVVINADRNACRGYAGQVDWHRENVFQIHGQRVGGVQSERKGRCRRSRPDHGIDVLERGVEVLLDLAAHLRRAEVILIIVAGTQRVGSEQDAATDFFAKSRRSRPLIAFDQVVGALVRVAVPHAVIAREVRRCLAQRDDVVGRQGVPDVRQRNRLDLDIGLSAQLLRAVPHIFEVLAADEARELFRNADGEFLRTGVQRRLQRRPLIVDRRRILRVPGNHDVEENGRIGHRLRDRARLVQG